MLPTFFCPCRTPRSNVNETLEAVVVSELDAAGFDLVEIRRGGSRSRPLLEVRIDRRDGSKVSVDDCAAVSRRLEERLESGGLVSGRYVLQVSSPGDRPIRTADEWRRFVGRWVSVLAPEHGGRFEGRLLDVTGSGDDALVASLEIDGRTREVPLAGVKEARLAFRI